MAADLHETSPIALLAIGFVLALLFGLVANQLSEIVVGEREPARAMPEHARVAAGHETTVNPEGT